MIVSGDTRALVLAPTVKDFELLKSIFFQNGLEAMACLSLEIMCAELSANGAGVLILSEEALLQGEALVSWLGEQPPWSDLPVLILARPGVDSNELSANTRLLGNVTLLERPMRVATIVSAVQSALRARARQYQMRELLADNARSEAALRANDKRKDEFLAILAHELRNPMAPISNGIQILNLVLDENPQTAAIGQMMQRQIGNMKRLVDDLLEVSRVTRGNLELRLEEVELSAVINTAIESSQPLLAASQHSLNLSLPQYPVYLHADAVRLAQVISNLLNNAAKYTPPQGDITLSAHQKGSEIFISVADNGVGIPPELQPKIFDMFMQIDRHRNSAQGGLGIGLTLVKSLTELHGGSVEVFSEGAGKGSQLTVRLPYSETFTSKTFSQVDTARDLSDLNLLVVDDNSDAADSLAMLLREFKASVRIAYGGSAALEVIKNVNIDAAILDVGMPDMNGLDLARQIRINNRAEDERKEVLLIALTGWGQEQDIINTHGAGFNHHLTKPVDLNKLIELLWEFKTTQTR